MKKKPAKKAKRRQNLHEQLSERRGKRPKKPETLTEASARGRVNTIPSNGDLPSSVEVAPEPVSIGEVMRQALDELGDIAIDPDLAIGQLHEIGEAYEEVVRRQAAYNARAEEAKTAKKSLEAAQEMVLEKVRAATHPKPLPLFDHQQAEDDRLDMLDAAADAGSDEIEHHADA